MAATHRYFRRTGWSYAICVIILAFSYPVIFHVNLNHQLVASIILLQGGANVIKYFFQGKLAILLRVDGRSYVTTNIQTCITIVSYSVQIILIVLGYDILIVMFAYFFINMCQMIFITWYVKRHYSWLNLSVKPDFESLKQSRFVIVHQLSALVFNNTDILLLTYFCGLGVVSVYSLYNLIFTSVATIIDTLCSSVEHVLGQAFNSNKERFIKLQETYETYYLGVAFAFFTLTTIMLPSFMHLYAGKFTDADYTNHWLPYLFASVYILLYARRTSSQIINFAGTFKQTQWRSLFESFINIVVSIILVQKVGIYGVLLGTIAALIYRTNDIIIYANWKILHRMPWQTYKRWCINFILMVIIVLICRNNLPLITNYGIWIFTSLIMAFIVFSLFLIIDTIFDKSALPTVYKILKK